jgi:hypothetical protein
MIGTDFAIVVGEQALPGMISKFFAVRMLFRIEETGYECAIPIGMIGVKYNFDWKANRIKRLLHWIIS